MTMFSSATMKHLGRVVGFGLIVVGASACGGAKPVAAKAPAAAPAAADPKVAHAEVSESAKGPYAAGWKAYIAGDLQAARSAFESAQRADATSPNPPYALGIVLEHLGEAASARASFRAALVAKPEFDLAAVAYARSLSASGDTAGADSFLTERRSKFPQSAITLAALADVKSESGNHGDAQQMAQDALRLNPNEAFAMVVIARDHYRARKIDLARYALQAVLDGFGDASPARAKDNAEAALLRGLLEREYGRRAAAMEAFEHASTHQPDLVEALLQLGAMRLEAGNATTALAVLEPAVRFAPRSALAQSNVGDAYRLLLRTPEALKAFDAAEKLDPALTSVHYNRALLYLFTANVAGMTPVGQVEAAIAELERYKSMKNAKGAADDVDELLSRAKSRQAELKIAAGVAAEAAAAPAAPAPAEPAAPGTAPAEAPGAPAARAPATPAK